MYKKPITFVDYNGNTRTEDFYFNLNEAELAKMELSVAGGLKERLERLIQEQNIPEILKEFEGIVELAYGVKSADGREFDKDPIHFKRFKQTEAYSKLFMEIAFDAKKAAEFVNGIVPARMSTPEAQNGTVTRPIAPSND